MLISFINFIDIGLTGDAQGYVFLFAICWDNLVLITSHTSYLLRYKYSIYRLFRTENEVNHLQNPKHEHT